MSDEELDALQARHLAYRAELVRRGKVVVNGPFDEQSDPSYRGMSIFACDPAEAARLSDDDPLVIVGRLVYDKLTDIPDTLYGRGIGSNYQAQSLKLSKHFKQD